MRARAVPPIMPRLIRRWQPTPVADNDNRRQDKGRLLLVATAACFSTAALGLILAALAVAILR